jgi:hypothetical protein
MDKVMTISIPNEYVYVVGVALIVILLIVIVYLCWYYNIEINSINNYYESQIKELREKLRNMAKRSTVSSSSEKMIVETIHNPQEKSKEKPKETALDSESESEAREEKKEQKVAYTYLVSSGKERFSQSFRGPERCFFRMWEEGNVLKYEFSGNVDKALANLNAVFDDTCHLQGSQMNARNIVNVTPGELDNQLNIIKKAVIKLVE